MAQDRTRALAGGAVRGIRRVSRKNRGPAWRFETTDYPERGVEYVVQGELVVQQQGKEFTVKPGGALLMFPNTRFTLLTRGDSSGFVVFNSKLTRELSHPACIVVEPHQRLREMADALLTALDDRSRFRQDLVLATADLLCIEAYRNADFSVPGETTSVEWLKTAEILLRTNATTSETVRSILAPVPVSYEHLSRLFKAQFGKSPCDFRIEVRVEHVKEMLRHTDDSITSIAFDLGYSSSQHLASEFRRLTNTSPTAFRNG